MDEETVEENVVAEDHASGTVPQVMEEVGDDPEAAREALDDELAKDEPRSTLVEALESVIADAEAEDEALDSDGGTGGESGPPPSDEDEEDAPAAESMTDRAQRRMVASTEQARAARLANLERNREIRKQQDEAVGR